MNRWTNQFRNQLQKGVVDVMLRVSFGASGAPTIASDTLNHKRASLGVTSIVRVSAGLYTVTFQDSFQQLYDARVMWLEAAAGTFPASPIMSVNAASPTNVNAAPGVLQIQFCNTSSVATDPASGEIAHMTFVMGNSTAL